uniref:PREDICTED: similar to pollike protein putative n=1 Tax=Albugo laibachii Nc14 TaxID=890382 RepID=F0WF51_9STRA|nr:PREDICTED: similar to pollike protein putative [Albugo laibachii Nc14]|eukprot:CCA19833.1 PREDICTED: similar to pollike protein putative [Albugo laibachii Nc14]
MAIQFGCSGCLASAPPRRTCLYWTSAEGKSTGLHPSVGISLPFRLQGLQICGTPSQGDHLANVLAFANPSQLQGRGYWKCPLSLFDFPVIKDAIEVEAALILESLRSFSRPGKDWEHQGLVRAQSDLDRAASAFRISNSLPDKTIYEAALRSYHERVTSSSQYHQDSMFDYHMQHMEQSSRHFFRPVDSKYHRVPLEEVLLPTGDVSKHPFDITLQFTDHWGGIMGDLSSSAGPPSPSLTRKELEGAIKRIRGRSSPRMDGLPAAFYQLAPGIFGECLHIVFADQLRRGSLLRSQRSSAITLLYKKWSRVDPGNYRPIALMCVDVRVLSKALAYRLQHVLPKLIHEDHKAFVHGRSIHHHIRYMSDLQDLVTHRGDTAYATFLDFEKAHDRVDWSYIFAIISKMNFGN